MAVRAAPRITMSVMALVSLKVGASLVSGDRPAMIHITSRCVGFRSLPRAAAVIGKPEEAAR